MAHKCTARWKSWVGVTWPPPQPPNDGELRVGVVKPNKKFKGKHKKTAEFDINGECNDAPHIIKFSTTEGFAYQGSISEKVFEGQTRDVAEGTRSMTMEAAAKAKSRKKPAPPDGDEEWIAVKVT